MLISNTYAISKKTVTQKQYNFLKMVVKTLALKIL